MADISLLSDTDLRKQLIDLGAAPGPITATTRNLWEKKLSSLSIKQVYADQTKPAEKKPSRKSVPAFRSPSRQSSSSAATASQEEKVESPQTNRRRTISGMPEIKSKTNSKKTLRRATLSEAKNLAPFSSDEEDVSSIPDTNGIYLVSDMQSSPIVIPDDAPNNRSAESSPSRLFTHNKMNGIVTPADVVSGYTVNSENFEQLPSKNLSNQGKQPDDSLFKRPSPIKRGFRTFHGEFSDSEDSPTTKNHAKTIATNFSSSKEISSSAPPFFDVQATQVKERYDLPKENREEVNSTIDFTRETVVVPPKRAIVLKVNQPVLKPVSTKSSYEAHVRRRSYDKLHSKLPEIRKELSSSIHQIRKNVLNSISGSSTATHEKNGHAETAAVMTAISSDESEEEEIDVEFAPRRIFNFSFPRRYLIYVASVVLLLSFGIFILMSPPLKPLELVGGMKTEDAKHEETLEGISDQAVKAFLDYLYEDLSYKKGKKQCGDRGVKDFVNEAEMLEIAEVCDSGWTLEHYKAIVHDGMARIDKYHQDSFIKSNESGEIEYASRQALKPLLCRVQESMMAILTRLFVIAIAVGVCLAAYFFMKHRWSTDDEDTRQMLYFVDKIISTLKKHDLVSKRNKELPPYLPIPHVRDMLIPPNQRKKVAHVWRKAVNFLNSSDSRVRVETQPIAGEDFEVWRWIGVTTVTAAMQTEKKTTPNHLGNGTEVGKCWQGPAFDEIEKVVRMPIVTPTPCLKVRYMHEGPEEKGENWEAQVSDAILEKCSQDGAQVLHVFVDRLSTEGCVYVKCDSLDSAGKAFRSIYGNWFDGRLVIVKFVTLARYHQRFPDALHSIEILQSTGKSPSSLQWEHAEISAT